MDFRRRAPEHRGEIYNHLKVISPAKCATVGGGEREFFNQGRNFIWA
jgi:hypothetical protein